MLAQEVAFRDDPRQPKPAARAARTQSNVQAAAPDSHGSVSTCSQRQGWWGAPLGQTKAQPQAGTQGSQRQQGVTWGSDSYQMRVIRPAPRSGRHCNSLQGRGPRQPPPLQQREQAQPLKHRTKKRPSLRTLPSAAAAGTARVGAVQAHTRATTAVHKHRLGAPAVQKTPNVPAGSSRGDVRRSAGPKKWRQRGADAARAPTARSAHLRDSTACTGATTR
jgi:hypothetical protein